MKLILMKSLWNPSGIVTLLNYNPHTSILASSTDEDTSVSFWDVNI